jgi:hypothetical protein
MTFRVLTVQISSYQRVAAEAAIDPRRRVAVGVTLLANAEMRPRPNV